jgi:hypothetical protein
MVSGCADFSALRNCEKSGEAHFVGIPLASRSEHEQAQRFAPLNPGNCRVYVVRENDWWTGSSVQRTTVMLTSVEQKVPLLPSELYTQYRDQVLEICEDVYAMWDLSPKSYLITAVFNRSFGQAQDRALALKVLEQEPAKGAIAQVSLDCRPGRLFFFGAGDRGFDNTIMLTELSKEDGKTYVSRGVRSVGFSEDSDKANSWYRDCPVDE